MVTRLQCQVSGNELGFVKFSLYWGVVIVINFKAPIYVRHTPLTTPNELKFIAECLTFVMHVHS